LVFLDVELKGYDVVHRLLLGDDDFADSTPF
jgi:hypothetical protein